MFDADFISRFEAKIRKSEGCWEWTALVPARAMGR